MLCPLVNGSNRIATHTHSDYLFHIYIFDTCTTLMSNAYKNNEEITKLFEF